MAAEQRGTGDQPLTALSSTIDGAPAEARRWLLRLLPGRDAAFEDTGTDGMLESTPGAWNSKIAGQIPLPGRALSS